MPIPLLASGIEQILPLAFFLLVFAALKWFQRPKDTEEDKEDSQPLSRDSQEKHPEEAMRKLMEALGLPVDAALPPPVVVQRVPKPVKPPLRLPPPPLSTPRSAKQVAPSKPTVRVKKRTQEVTTATSISYGLRDSLREPQSLRRAIILREILGPPKAF